MKSNELKISRKLSLIFIPLQKQKSNAFFRLMINHSNFKSVLFEKDFSDN